MAKEKSKKQSSVKTKKDEQKAVTPPPQVIEEPQPDPTPPPNSIKIEAVSYENIKTTYPLSDLTIKFELEGVTLYESPKTKVLTFDVIDTDFDFVIPCDLTNPKDREKYISSPLIVTVTETERVVDIEELNIQIETPPKKESAPSTEVATPSTATSKSKVTKKGRSDKKSKKSEKGKKRKKGSEKASKSSSKVSSTSTLPQKPTGPIVLGMAKLDLLPLFLGYSFFNEALYIERIPPTFDETATALENLLKVKVNVSLEGPEISTDTTTVLNVTVESFYNIPSLVTTDFQYELCCLIPNETELEPVVFNKGRLANENQKFKYKLWPRVAEEQIPIPSTYRIPDDLDGVKNFVDIDLDPVVWGTSTRIEWNIIKRQFLTDDRLANLKYHLWKYRKIPIEIYITPIKETDDEKQEDTSAKKKSPKKEKGGSKKDKKDKGSKSKTSDKSPAAQTAETPEKTFDTTVDYLHIMVLVDIGYLLYPGVTKCRMACPLRTYQEIEVLEQAGLQDSYFRPKPPAPPPEVAPAKKPDKKGDKKHGKKADKKGSGKSKEGKGSKSKSSKSSKSSKTKKGKGKKEKAAPVEGADLAELLPLPPPPPPPPSKEVLNDQGQPAFIILEFELLRPLAAKRQLEDLDEEMSKFLPKRPDLPKKFISSKVSEEIYCETIRALLTDMNLQYRSYLEEKKSCSCDVDSFQTYLQQTGTYQTYLSTIIRSLSMMVPQKYSYKKGIFQSAQEFHSFVAKVYVDIVQDMNSVINENQILYTSSGDHRHYVKNDKLLLYAKEAMELGEQVSAERYFLERICCRENDPNCWFDYAVFLMEINELEKATECITEVVQIRSIHKYGLMMYGLLLSDKNMITESETCLLRMIILNPSWSEGWIVLHSFYKRIGNLEGTEFSWEMAKKWFAENKEGEKDYFNSTDDLAWSSAKLTDDIFLRTAGLLIKMRLYEHAERVMSYSLFIEKGLYKYLRGAIAYLKKDYTKSLEYLHAAEQLVGLDYGICSLIGHCYIKLNNFENALKHYEVVLGMFNRPDDIHLVLMNGAMAYDVVNESQKARLLALRACHLSPTPQTWLFAGGFYYVQNDLMSAEECLVQANLCDNRLPDPWAYLALISFQLGRRHQSDLCLTQAKKCNVEGKPVVRNIEGMIRVEIKHRHEKRV